MSLVALKIAGLLLLFDTGSALAFDGPKSSFSLATASVLFTVSAWAVLKYGTAILVRSRLHVVVVAFILANVVAIAFAQDRYLAVFGAQRRLGLTFVLDMAVLYFAVALAYRKPKDWAVLAITIGTAGAVAIAYGVAQFAGLDPIPWVDDVRRRPPSTFGNPDKFGHFLGASLVAAAGLAVLPIRVLPLGRVRLVAAAYAIAALAMAALIATRGTVLGLAVAVPALVVVVLRLSVVRTGRRVVIGAIGAVFGIALLSAIVLVATPLGDRLRAGFADGATQQRVFVAEAAIRAFLDRPIIGHGPDNFGVIYPLYRPPDSVSSVGILVNQDSAHSLPLQTAATTGLLGVLSLGALAGGSLLALWRNVPATPVVAVPLLAAGVAYWSHGLVAIGSVSVDWIAWVVAGGASTLGRYPVAMSVPRRLPLIVQAVPVALALALVVSGLAAFQANRELYSVRAARSPQRALPPAERAVRLDPGRAEHWFALAQARRDGGALGEAAQSYQAATDRAPHVSAYWTNLALTLTNLSRAGDQSLGGKDAALAAARRAVAADPYFPTPYHVLALIENSFGDQAAALEASTTAIRLYKSEPEYESVAADAALRLQDASAARFALERILQMKDAPVLRVALARVSLKLSDVASARGHLQRALELDPQYGPARELTQQLNVSAP